MNPNLSGISQKMKIYNYYKTPDGRVYLACPKKCNLCQEWNKEGQRWKVFVFMPLHCHLCCFAGYEDDFELKNGRVFCNSCYEKLKKRIKKIILGF